MTYTEHAQQKHGMHACYWRKGWNDRQQGRQPAIPRHYSHYDELAYKDGYKDAGDIVRANWHAIGVVS